ncbi:MAG: carboxylate-amine ligase [Steroidobacteraceae bacterium]|nr:carboxylate-amine ligase [Steroidobacteraceae bacterium]MDW8260772.1 carboxylate-amine ligase [Gammaproteobacteria bacterium]
MSLKEPPLTVGIEEEYLLVDTASGDLDNDPPPDLLRECAELGDGQISPEFLRCQLEVGTRVCRTMTEARADLARLRGIIATVCRKYGRAPIAASTHPFARALTQKRTDKERYLSLAREMQAAARRMVIGGMHVHVGIDDDELRIDLMNQMAYFLPHLLALSCSSPFWEGEQTGLKSFRMTVFNSLPRTGLPERFASYGEFRRHLDMLIRNGIVEDTSKIWWDIRPSARYPTLETRIMDCCTSIDDSIALAALNVCLLRMLFRLRSSNQRWRDYPYMLVAENRWRAMRYSFDERLLDLAKGELVPYGELLDELLALLAPDAQALGCSAEIEHNRQIVARGTSAHRQLAVYERARSQGATEREALQAVVAWLVRETCANL